MFRVCLLLVLCLPAVAQTPVAELNALYKEFFEFTLREFPEAATSVGRAEYADRWTDYSPAAVEKRRAAVLGFLKRANAYQTEALPESERMNHRLFRHALQTELDSADLGAYYFVASHLGGAVRAVAATLDIAPARTVRDLENQIARLKATRSRVDGLIAAANEGLRRKLLFPRLSVDLAVRTYESQAAVDAAKTPLLKAFRNMPASIPEAERRRLLAEATAAYDQVYRPATKAFAEYLKTSYAPATRTTIGLADNFNGRELYQIQIARHTTTRLTAQQIHDIGRKEMARLDAEMAAIRKSVGFSGSATEFDEKVLRAPGMLFRSEDEILVHARDISKRIDPLLPTMFKVLPRMPYGVAAIPADIARTAAPHYRGPAMDGSRAGYFYLRTVDPEKQSKCCMESLILHEAVPGHHLQIALAVEMPNVPEFRRMSGYAAFSEGWGLYAESLGEELGMYKSPYERYGRLQTEIMRAARLVVDTGVHALGWTRDQMFATMAPSKGGWINDDFLASEVDRYIANPGQALAYKIGGLKIGELRRKAEQALGPKFSVRDFHDVVLRNGGIPLDILEEEVDRWIAQAGK